jgi:PBSX family phage terminase large subunit
MKNLTVQQKLFADEYIKNGGNATEAARKANYSNPNSQASRLLLNVGISEYIAEKMVCIEKEKGYDIMSLAEIQARRSKIGRGEETDSFGFSPDFTDQLKAMSDLEKALKIKEEQEEKKRLEEEARNAKPYHLDLDIIPDNFHWVIRDIRNRKHLEYDFAGGRGSTKSSTVANMIIELLKNNHDIHAVVCRQVGVTIKDSVYAKIKWAIGKQEIEEEFDSKLSPLEITLKATGQKIYFRGADDPDKIKSINPEFGYIGILWFEELDQFTGPAAVRKIEQSAIRGGDIAWIFKSFNPPKSANNWANEYINEPKENRIVHRSTYKDVPEEWLGKPFLDEAEHLKKTNPEAYEHEYGGVANGNGGNVFQYLEFRDIADEEISHMDRIYQGVDWGLYPDPFAFVRLHYDHARETIYFIDEFVCNNTSNTITGNEIISRGYDDYVVTCDSAEKKSVNDYKDLGIAARSAIKGPGSVEYGMKWLINRKIVIDPKRTPYVYKEFKKYEYARDKEGNIISGYPDKDNHTIDATRYALEAFCNKRGNSA